MYPTKLFSTNPERDNRVDRTGVIADAARELAAMTRPALKIVRNLKACGVNIENGGHRLQGIKLLHELTGCSLPIAKYSFDLAIELDNLK